MNRNSILTLVIFAAVMAVVVTVIMKILGYSNPTVMGAAVAGGVVGALGSMVLKKKKNE